MLNWTTGEGNARYWVLKLLIEEFAPGDALVETDTVTNPLCAVVDGHASYSSITLSCASSGTVISSIDFAAFGTPSGNCGSFQHNKACDAANATAFVRESCLHQTSCTFTTYPTFGDPCYGTFKRFVVQARCSGDAPGQAQPLDPSLGLPYAQGFVGVRDGIRRVLLVNKYNKPANVTVPGLGAGSGGTLRTVDLATADGPPRTETAQSDVVLLAPFAVTVALLPE
jgi:hypothetical protein